MADETRPPETPADAPYEAPRPTLGRITRVRLRNYKSIVSCDVQLEPLTLLVGPNGSGKSNFLDALAFVSEALTLGLDQAIRNRGNLDRILSAAREPGDDSFSIQLEMDFASGGSSAYGFTVERNIEAGFVVRDDIPRLVGDAIPEARRNIYRAVTDDEESSRSRRQSLFVQRYADELTFRPLHELLSKMVFYNPQPDQLRTPVAHDVTPTLSVDGRNTASILRRMQTSGTDDLQGVLPYLKRVLPGLEAITVKPFQGYDHLTFVLRQGADGKTAEFSASQMSDGTLRALATLVALFQGRLGGKLAPSLVGIEEPENTIHPYAARILLAAMQSASHHTQVLATTHSADMLHMGDADLRSVLVVTAKDGVTRIGPIDAVSQGIVRDNIYTLGELLQMDQLFPEPPAQAANGDAAAHQPVGGGT